MNFSEKEAIDSHLAETERKELRDLTGDYT